MGREALCLTCEGEVGGSWSVRSSISTGSGALDLFWRVGVWFVGGGRVVDDEEETDFEVLLEEDVDCGGGEEGIEE